MRPAIRNRVLTILRGWPWPGSEAYLGQLPRATITAALPRLMSPQTLRQNKIP